MRENIEGRRHRGFERGWKQRVLVGEGERDSRECLSGKERGKVNGAAGENRGSEDDNNGALEWDKEAVWGSFE